MHLSMLKKVLYFQAPEAENNGCFYTMAPESSLEDRTVRNNGREMPGPSISQLQLYGRAEVFLQRNKRRQINISVPLLRRCSQLTDYNSRYSHWWSKRMNAVHWIPYHGTPINKGGWSMSNYTLISRHIRKTSNLITHFLPLSKKKRYRRQKDDDKIPQRNVCREFVFLC